ncbi:MAG: DUF2207 domain-containing protein [Peptostreptococcaceae bacterium]|nr:DUF2207 domain-containing protein [Peptostreptococcaceae bacterium]
MKRFQRWTVVLIILLGMSTAFVHAEEKIDNISIEMLIHDDGSADITQVWDIETHEGTEFYITMSNMGDMEVQNFQVVDETGRAFTFVERWDVKGSIEDKAYKCGFNPISGGFEMCWGKGSYGRHTYILQYRLTGLVKSYPDYDGFNTRLINDKMDPSVQNVNITVRFADEAKGRYLNEEKVGIWAFGHKGSIYFDEEKVVLRTDEPIGSYNYVNVMMRFEKGLIRPVSVGMGTFEELKERAFEGSDYSSSQVSGPIMFLTRVFVFCIFILPWAGFLWIIVKAFRSGSSGGADRDLKRDFYRMGGDPKNAQYSRQIPMGGSLDATHWAIAKVGEKMRYEYIMAAHILRLIQIKAITPISEESENFLGFTKESIRFKISDARVEDPLLESMLEPLMSILRSASGPDRILEEKELKKWAKRNHERIEIWFTKAQIRGEEVFRMKQGFVMKRKGKIFRSTVRELTPAGFELIDRTFGFRKMLEDLTLISEREVKEVELWDEYLIFAALFGIADKVAKQMEAIYPDFGQRSSFMSGDYRFSSTLHMVSAVNHAICSGYRSGVSSASSSARSFGGGGSSSFGGGGGFSGGGSGGGSR